jgi:hypothetical protein
MIWTYKNIKTNPVKTTHSDIVGTLVEMNNRIILIIAVYAPAKANLDDEEL